MMETRDDTEFGYYKVDMTMISYEVAFDYPDYMDDEWD